MLLPKDPVMLLSYVNTQLRDFYCNLDDLCSSLSITKSVLEETLNRIDYQYDSSKNQFV